MRHSLSSSLHQQPLPQAWPPVWPLVGFAIFVWLFYSHLSALLTFTLTVLLGVYIFLEPVTWLERGLWWLLCRYLTPNKATAPNQSSPLWLRGTIIVFVYGTLTLGGLIALTSLGPTILSQLAQLGATVPNDLIQTVARLLHHIEQWTGSSLVDLSTAFISPTVPTSPSEATIITGREAILSQWLNHKVTCWTSQWLVAHTLTPQTLPSLMQHSLTNIGPWVINTAQALVWSVLALMAIFYSLLFGPQWKLCQRAPVFLQAHQVMQGFIRGQVLLGAITGIYMFIVYSLFGVKYALLMAVLFGVVEILPVIGTWLGIIPGLALAWLSGGVWTAFGVFACSYVYQTIKDNIVAPKIVGDVMGLHPVVVMASILLWGKLGGLLGVVMAIPITALGWALWQPVANAAANANPTVSPLNTPTRLFSTAALTKTALVLTGFWLVANTLPEALVLASVVWVVVTGLSWLVESVERTFSTGIVLFVRVLRIILPSLPATLSNSAQEQIFPTPDRALWLWRVRRLMATGMVLASVALMGITLLLHWVPVVSHQWGRLLESLPKVLQSLPYVFGLHGWVPSFSLFQALSENQHWLTWLKPLWQPATGLATVLLSISMATVLWALLGSVFLAYGLMDAAALRKGWLGIFPQSVNMAPLWERMEHRLRLAVSAQWVWASIVGLASYLLLEATHATLAEGLATLFGLGYLLPTVGPWFGSIPIVLATSTQGLWGGLLVWLALVWGLSTLKRRYWLPAWNRWAHNNTLNSTSNTLNSNSQSNVFELAPLWWVAGSVICLEALGASGLFVIIPFTVVLATLMEKFTVTEEAAIPPPTV